MCTDDQNTLKICSTAPDSEQSDNTTPTTNAVALCHACMPFHKLRSSDILEASKHYLEVCRTFQNSRYRVFYRRKKRKIRDNRDRSHSVKGHKAGVCFKVKKQQQQPKERKACTGNAFHATRNRTDIPFIGRLISFTMKGVGSPSKDCFPTSVKMNSQSQSNHCPSW